MQRFLTLFFALLPLLALNACDNAKPPELMKASKQFESDEIRDQHIAYMRTHHMHALKHKRDETVYNGIRTEQHSLNACINCHVPESYKGKVLRHTDPEHFCTTCHTYVAEKLDCFECHVDHPVRDKIVNQANNASDAFVIQGLPTPVDMENKIVDKSRGVSFLVSSPVENEKTHISRSGK